MRQPVAKPRHKDLNKKDEMPTENHRDPGQRQEGLGVSREEEQEGREARHEAHRENDAGFADLVDQLRDARLTPNCPERRDGEGVTWRNWGERVGGTRGCDHRLRE